MRRAKAVTLGGRASMPRWAQQARRGSPRQRLRRGDEWGVLSCSLMSLAVSWSAAEPRAVGLLVPDRDAGNAALGLRASSRRYDKSGVNPGQSATQTCRAGDSIASRSGAMSPKSRSSSISGVPDVQECGAHKPYSGSL